MPTISQMVTGTAPVTIQFHGITVKAAYYPGKVTEDIIAQIDALATVGASTETRAGYSDLDALLTELIASWDLTEDDGVTMIPIDAEHLRTLPVLFRQQALLRIVEDMRPN